MRLFAQATILLVLFTVGMLPLTSNATIFFTDLEAVADQTDPALTTTVNDNTLSADFKGGTIDFLSIGALYHSGKKSWMVSPDGDTAPMATGESTGTGTITLSEPAVNVLVYGRNQSLMTVAVVRLIDTNDMLINAEFILNSTGWTTIDVTRMQGETLIAKIELEVQSTKGMGMAALDDLSYNTTAGSDEVIVPVPVPVPVLPPVDMVVQSSSSGSMFMLPFVSLLLLSVLRRQASG